MQKTLSAGFQLRGDKTPAFNGFIKAGFVLNWLGIDPHHQPCLSSNKNEKNQY